MNDGDRIEFAGGELPVNRLGANGRTPFHLQPLGRFATALGYVEPFVRERAVHAVQDAFLDEIADGPLHHAPGGRSGQINQLLGGKQGLELRLDFAVEVFEPLAAMTDHGGAKGLQRFFADFDGTGNEELDVWHNNN